MASARKEDTADTGRSGIFFITLRKRENHNVLIPSHHSWVCGLKLIVEHVSIPYKLSKRGK